MEELAMRKIILQSYTRIYENAHISGIALIPRISRNNNLYTKRELERFDGVTVPLNWEHNPSKEIGTVTFHYNPKLETVYYDGIITDEAAANVARNKTLFTSIEANPQEMREVCNGKDDCFSMPYGLKPVGLALTETPGVPETTVKIIENYIKECQLDKDLEATVAKNNPGISTRDFSEFKEKVYSHLGVEECEDCGDLHVKKESVDTCKDCGEPKKNQK